MADIIPFTQYFPQESLSQAKMRGEQLRQLEAQGVTRQAQQQGMMRAYGSPTQEDLAFQQATAQKGGIETQRMSAVSGLLDNLYGSVAKVGFDKDAIEMIRNNQGIAEAVSPIMDIQTWNPHERGEDFVYTGPTTPATIDGKPDQLTTGKPYTKLMDGTFKTRPMTAEDTARTQPSGKDPVEGIMKRISTIESAKNKLATTGGLSPIDLYMYKSQGLDIPEGDPKAAIAALEMEKQMLEKKLPKEYRTKEDIVKPIPDLDALLKEVQ